eukprot:Amastigsp_a176681_27.p1 type:complete len:317 gc:universal Amastigsp_a176681_27:1021-71(-)
MSASRTNFRSSLILRCGVHDDDHAAGDKLRDGVILALLEEERIAYDKLREVIIARSGLGPQLRPIVWQLLLQLLPPDKSVWEFVRTEQRSQFQDLCEITDVLSPRKLLDEIGGLAAAPGDEALVCMLSAHVTWAVASALAGQESRSRTLCFSAECSSWLRFLWRLARTCLRTFEGDTSDAFWAFQTLLADSGPLGVALLPSNKQTALSLFLEALATADPELRQHWAALDDDLALSTSLVQSAFIDLVPEAGVPRVVDVVLASSWRLLPFVGVAVLLSVRAKILRCKSAASARETLAAPQGDTEPLIARARDIAGIS